jgi:hypothetical protein
MRIDDQGIGFIESGECLSLTRIEQQKRLFSYWIHSGVQPEEAKKMFKEWLFERYSGDSRSLARNSQGVFRSGIRWLRKWYAQYQAGSKGATAYRCLLLEPDCEKLLGLMAECELPKNLRLKFFAATFRLIQFAKHVKAKPRSLTYRGSFQLAKLGIVPLPKNIVVKWCEAHNIVKFKAEWKRLGVAKLAQGANPAANRCEHWRIDFEYYQPNMKLAREMGRKRDAAIGNAFTAPEQYLAHAIAETKMSTRQLYQLLGKTKSLEWLIWCVRVLKKHKSVDGFIERLGDSRFVERLERMRVQNQAWIRESKRAWITTIPAMTYMRRASGQ